MKKILLLFILFLVSSNTSAQNFYLKIIGQTEKENKIIDSIDYVLKHQNTKSIIDENNLFYQKLTQKGYAESQFAENFKLNDSTFCFKYDIGKKINFARIYIGKENQENIVGLYTIKNDTLTLAYEECENFLNATLRKLESNGFSMAKVKLINLQKNSSSITADLSITKENKRKLRIMLNQFKELRHTYWIKLCYNFGDFLTVNG